MHPRGTPTQVADQRHERVLLLLYVAALVLMIGAAFLDSGSLVERWAQFVQSVRGY